MVIHNVIVPMITQEAMGVLLIFDYILHYDTTVQYNSTKRFTPQKCLLTFH